MMRHTPVSMKLKVLWILCVVAFLNGKPVPAFSGDALTKELDRDLGGNLLDRLLNFLGGLGQPVGVDIDADPAPGTRHVLIRLELSDRLLEIVPAIRTLKPDLVGCRANHQENASRLPFYSEACGFLLVCHPYRFILDSDRPPIAMVNC